MVAPLAAGAARVAAGALRMGARAAAGLGRAAVGMGRARAGHAARGGRAAVAWEWFGDQVFENIEIGLEARLRLAGQLLRDKVVVNISLPVGRNAQGKVVERSLPGEFPRVETSRLMKDIFWEMTGPRTVVVGTTLDYGLILETQMDRSFLVRTLEEMQPQLQRIISAGPPSLPGQEGSGGSGGGGRRRDSRGRFI